MIENQEIEFSANFLKTKTKNLEINLPFIACWPTQAIIWEILMKEPFEPQSAIVKGAFDLCNAIKEALPALSRIADSSFKMRLSNV